MTSWLLQSNPRTLAADDFDRRPRQVTSRCVVRYRDEIAPGDGCVLWVSGRAAGVYGLGTVLTPAVAVDDQDSAPPGRRRFALRLRVDAALGERPVPRAVLAADPRFASAAILGQPFAANPFRLTPLEWEAVVDLAGEATATDQPGGRLVSGSSRTGHDTPFRLPRGVRATTIEA